MEVSCSLRIFRKTFRLHVWVTLVLLLNAPIPSLSCGRFSSNVEVIRPTNAEALFDLPLEMRNATVGDRFAIILPTPTAGKEWRVLDANPEITKAFKPTDETGPNVFAWRFVKPGSTFILVTEITKNSEDARSYRFVVTVAPAWSPEVIVLDESNAGKTVEFEQRSILKIRLLHPDNLAGYWKIEKGLSDLDVEYGGDKIATGIQTFTSNHWVTEINIDTTHMPTKGLLIGFHTELEGRSSLISKTISYKLKGRPAPKC